MAFEVEDEGALGGEETVGLVKVGEEGGGGGRLGCGGLWGAGGGCR